MNSMLYYPLLLCSCCVNSLHSIDVQALGQYPVGACVSAKAVLALHGMPIGRWPGVYCSHDGVAVLLEAAILTV